MEIKLTVEGGPHAGKVFTFSEHRTFIVGRSPQVHFPLPAKDPNISRHHFFVEVNPLCAVSATSAVTMGF